MIAQLQHDPVPLREDREGTIRVGGTRVTLETVITAFESGATAEQIAQDFPSLNLADIYTSIGFYLRHQAEVAAYLQRQRADAELIRQEIESHPETQAIRERLLARRASKDRSDDPAGGG